MEWDGRAKVLLCYYSTCNHVVRLNPQKPIPSEDHIIRAIHAEETHLDKVREGAVSKYMKETGSAPFSTLHRNSEPHG